MGYKPKVVTGADPGVQSWEWKPGAKYPGQYHDKTKNGGGALQEGSGKLPGKYLGVKQTYSNAGEKHDNGARWDNTKAPAK